MSVGTDWVSHKKTHTQPEDTDIIARKCAQITLKRIVLSDGRWRLWYAGYFV